MFLDLLPSLGPSELGLVLRFRKYVALTARFNPGVDFRRAFVQLSELTYVERVVVVSWNRARACPALSDLILLHARALRHGADSNLRALCIWYF